MSLSDALRRFFLQRFRPQGQSGPGDRLAEQMERDTARMEERLRALQWDAEAVGIRRRDDR